MRITVKAGDLQAEVTLSKQQAQKLHRDVWAQVRSASFAAERKVKRDMPVDTGRARASWGHWTVSSLRMPKTKSAVDNLRKASAGDAVWEENERDLTIEQGSNVEYVPKLNAGYNRKRISGFIDAAEKDAQRELDYKIDALLSRYF